MRNLERYRVLVASEELRSFTVERIAAVAAVSAATVLETLGGLQEWFEVSGIYDSFTRRPTVRYRLREERVGELLDQIQGYRGQLGADWGVEVCDSLVPHESPAMLALRVAEIELSDRFREATTRAERASVLNRAGDLLLAARELNSSDAIRRRHAAESLLKKRLKDLMSVPPGSGYSSMKAVCESGPAISAESRSRQRIATSE